MSLLRRNGFIFQRLKLNTTFQYPVGNTSLAFLINMNDKKRFSTQSDSERVIALHNHSRLTLEF